MEQNRRRYLSLVGLVVSGAIAGCTDDSDPEGEIESDSNSEEDEPDDSEEDDETTEEDDSEEEEEEEEDEGDDPEYVNQVDGQVVFEYGETARVSNGIEATVHGVSLYDQMGDSQPEERDVFAVVQVSTENTSDEQRNLPGAAGGGWELFYTGQRGEYPDPPWSGMKPTLAATNH